MFYQVTITDDGVTVVEQQDFLVTHVVGEDDTEIRDDVFHEIKDIINRRVFPAPAKHMAEEAPFVVDHEELDLGPEEFKNDGYDRITVIKERPTEPLPAGQRWVWLGDHWAIRATGAIVTKDIPNIQINVPAIGDANWQTEDPIGEDDYIGD